MQLRGILHVSSALFLGIAVFTLHLIAMSSPRWKITKRDRPPIMEPVSYGLWERCEYLNFTVMKQGVALGTRPNVQICRPNHYMRYSADKFNSCYYIRRTCSVRKKSDIPEGCSCRYLPSTRALQWLTILAAIFLGLGLFLLYIRPLITPQNDSANLVLSFGPFIAFFLALVLMVTTLIVLGAYLRRDTYEDYTFPLETVSNDTTHLQGFDLHSLRNYAKHHESTFSHNQYKAAEKELYLDAHTHYHTIIGRATVYEIIATVLLFIVNALTFWLGTKSRSDSL